MKRLQGHLEMPIYFLGVATLCVMLFLEPFTKLFIKTPEATLLPPILEFWLAISIIILLFNIPLLIKSKHLLIGFSTICILSVRFVFSGQLLFELLPLSYSIIFLSMAVITNKISIPRKYFENMIYIFSAISLIYLIFSNLLALGLAEVQQVSIGEQRFSIIGDGNTALLTIPIACSLLLSTQSKRTTIFAYSIIILAFFRLISFGSKGPVATGAAILIVAFIYYRPKFLPRLVFIFFVSYFVIIPLIAMFSPQLTLYIDLFGDRIGNQQTWLARLSEASNDFQAFTEKPLLGWGRDVPGFNILEETSSGHITITGTLARMGLIGTFGLSVFYYYYFKFTKLRVSPIRSESSTIAILFFCTSLFIIYLLALGNPLYLFPPWAFIPCLFPSIIKERST